MHYLYGQVRVTVFVHISQTTHTKASQHFLDILGEVCYHWRPRSCNLIFVQTSSINRTCQFLQFASKAFPCWLCPSARSAFPGMELLREHPLVPTGKNSWKLRLKFSCENTVQIFDFELFIERFFWRKDFGHQNLVSMLSKSSLALSRCFVSVVVVLVVAIPLSCRCCPRCGCPLSQHIWQPTTAGCLYRSIWGGRQRFVIKILSSLDLLWCMIAQKAPGGAMSDSNLSW